MFRELGYSVIVWCLCFALIAQGYGCRKNTEDEKEVSENSYSKMYQETFKITNTGSVDIAELKIVCDGNATVIKDIKVMKPVYTTITRKEIASFSFEISYVDGKVIKHPPKNRVLCSNRETQIVIEDGGKMYSR